MCVKKYEVATLALTFPKLANAVDSAVNFLGSKWEVWWKLMYTQAIS